MLRATLFALTMFTPTLSHAFCDGPDITGALSPADLAELNDTVAVTPFGQGLYWSATKDGAELAIIGTMHLPDPRHDALLTRVMPELDRADILLVEATLDDQSAMQTYMAQNPDLMTITDGPTLPELLDAETWGSIRDAAATRGVPGFMAAKMQPWFLSMTLAIPPCALSAMVAGEGGLDAMLMAHATDVGVPVMALEPWQDMLALLASGTFDEQIDALRFSIIDTEIQDALIATLTRSYFDESVAFGWHINSYLIDFMPNMDPDLFAAQMAELEEDLLNARNRNWIPVINAAAQTHDRVFVAFGAAHLIGESGVLRLLEQDGWTIAAR